MRRFLERENYILLALFGLTLILRIVGILYGLPLMAIPDEPPFVLGALTMLQLHTVVPAFHISAFSSVLYYNPYLCYIYLLPFALAAGIKFLLWHGTTSLFIAHLLSNLTVFFIIARCISIMFALASVYLVYRIAQALFKSNVAAGVAAFLVATSISHTALSMVARHWVPASFCFLLVLYILTRTNIPENKKYFFSLIMVGVGSGISTEVLLAIIPVALWYFLQSHVSIKKILQERLVWLGGGLFVALALLPSILYPRSNGFLGNVTLFDHKSLLGLIESPFNFLSSFIPSEPVLMGLFLLGLLFLWFENRRIFFFITLYFYLYAIIFYIFFRFEARFALPLIPVVALIGGYAAARMLSYWNNRTLAIMGLCIILAIPTVAAVRLSFLATQNDTRELAREWTLEHLTPQDKVLVYADLTRLPASAAAVAELRAIDPSAVRRVDEADATLNNTNTPYALNLYAVNNPEFFANLVSYAHTHAYTYLIYQPSNTDDPAVAEDFAALTTGATIVAQWNGFENVMSIKDSEFSASVWQLFAPKLLGPTMVIYKLP